MDLFGSVAGVTAAVRLLRDERRRVAKKDPHPELVVTGPDLGGVKSRDTRVVVREMFESARHSVLIVGYAFYGSDRIFQPLADRMVSNSGLTVRIIVNVHPERGLSAEQTVRKFGEDFLRTKLAFRSSTRDLLLPRVIGGPRVRTCERPCQAHRCRPEARLSWLREFHDRRVPTQPRGWYSAQ